MLSTPQQNSEIFHRAEVTADIVKLEAQRMLAEHAHAGIVQKRIQHLHDSSVLQTDSSAALEPDAEKQEAEQKQKKRKKGPGETGSQESTPPHTLGPGHVDITV